MAVTSALAQAPKAELPGITIELQGSEVPGGLRRTIDDLSRSGTRITLRTGAPAAPQKPDSGKPKPVLSVETAAVVAISSLDQMMPACRLPQAR